MGISGSKRFGGAHHVFGDLEPDAHMNSPGSFSIQDNYLADVEQATFSPANVVPGSEQSPGVTSWDSPPQYDLDRTAAPFEKTRRAISGAAVEVLFRHIESCRRAHPAYGQGVARALGIENQWRHVVTSA